jgi:hypothetical protein
MNKRSNAVQQWQVGGRVRLNDNLGVVGTIVAKPAEARVDSSRVCVQFGVRGPEAWMKTKLTPIDEEEYEHSLRNSVHAYVETVPPTPVEPAAVTSVVLDEELEDWPSCEPFSSADADAVPCSSADAAQCSTADAVIEIMEVEGAKSGILEENIKLQGNIPHSVMFNIN